MPGKAQVDKLMAFLRDLGARDWFSSYYSPVLDGKQWQLFDGCRSHEGFNAYPKGFEKLLKYLADKFGCEEMRPQSGDTRDGPTESEYLAMLAFLRPAKRRRGQAKAGGRHLRTLDKEASRAFVGPLEDASLPSRPLPRIARGGCGPSVRLRPPWNASPSGASAMKQSSCNKRRSLRASP